MICHIKESWRIHKLKYVASFLFSEDLAADIVNCGAMPSLLGLVKQSIHSNPVLCRTAVSAISELMNAGKGKESSK